LANNQFLVACINWRQADLLRKLGQFGPAIELIQAVLAAGQESATLRSDALLELGILQAERGEYAPARANLQTVLKQREQTGGPFNTIWTTLWLAHVAWLEGRAINGQAANPPVLRAGIDHAQRVIALCANASLNLRAELTLAFMIAARLHLALSETDEALTHSTEAVRLMATLPFPPWPEISLFTHAQALRAAGRTAEADEHLRKAYERVMLVASKTQDEVLRGSWLENVRDNREIVKEWTLRNGDKVTG